MARNSPASPLVGHVPDALPRSRRNAGLKAVAFEGGLPEAEGARALALADDAPETLLDQGSYRGAFAGGKLPRLGQKGTGNLDGSFHVALCIRGAIEVSRVAAAGSALLAVAIWAAGPAARRRRQPEAARHAEPGEGPS